MNFMKRVGIVAATMMMLLCGTGAVAAPMKYSITGTGSGAIGGFDFTSQAFDISFVGNPTGATLLIDPLTFAQVSVSGLPVATLEIATRVGVNSSRMVVYFSRTGSSKLDLFDFFLDAPIYNLNSQFSVTGTSVFGLDQFRGVASSEGPISFYSASGIVFSSAPVPEPETYAMMLAGLGLVGFAARRRRKRA